MNGALIGLAFVLGAVIGSFLNVVAARLPAGESILWPGSRCPSCRAPIRWHDNVPIVSFILLGAKCRSCRAPISWRYPAVEGITGLLFAGIVFRYGLTADAAVLALFAAALVVISAIDLDHRIIPDVISLPGIAVGILASLVPGKRLLMPILYPGFSPALESFLGAAFGFLFLWGVAAGYEWLMKREGMGMGDAKLLAMMGAFLGLVPAMPIIILASSLVGSLTGIAFGLARGGDLRTFKVPFGPFLAAGALIQVFFGVEIFLWYVGRFR